MSPLVPSKIRRVAAADPESRKRFVIETGRPFGRSRIWQLQNEYFAARGVEAWRLGEVPHYVTSNPAIADSYAEIIFAFWRDRRRLAPQHGDAPLTICELGAGSGRFAFHFLRRLDALCMQAGVAPQAFRYVLSDAADANLEFWRRHPCFEPWVADRRLDIAKFDLTHSGSLALQASGDSIGPGSLSQPLVAIANYVFDSIAPDLFRFKDRRAYAAMVSLTIDEDPAGLDATALLARLELRTEYEEMAEPAYPEAWLQRLFGEYRHALRDTHLLFPATGLRALRRLAEFSNSGMLVLTADKGTHRLADLDGQEPPPIVRHGSVSLAVNYHAFTRSCEHGGGLALVPSRRHRNIGVIGLLMLPDAARHDETRHTYQRHVRDFGPDDFYRVIKHARKTVAQMPVEAILAYLQLSRYDGRQLAHCLPRLMELVAELDAAARHDLVEAIEAVWEMYFPLGERFDLAHGIAGLLYAMQDYEPALLFYERSMAIYGPDTGTLCNIASCYHRLGEYAIAAAVAHRILEYEPDNAAAKALLAAG
jgi:tetratricopeptide (TPR) repeat protein